MEREDVALLVFQVEDLQLRRAMMLWLARRLENGHGTEAWCCWTCGAVIPT